MQQTQQTMPKTRDLRRADGRGKLKIFFGYAAGIGKTYTMLQAARRAKQEGIDVVVGCIELHTRPDTLALMEGLEQLPCTPQGNFDVEAACNRRPQLLLVEDLAHVNPQGSLHAQRYQDIQDLLKLGVTVYTTVDVQHLESLKESVRAVSGKEAPVCIPDYIFDMANSVELVDLEPDDLLVRLKNCGHEDCLTRQQLTALRSIALRRAADRLGHIARRISGEYGIQTDEHVMVCLSGSPTNATVIRTAARMAEAFQGDLTALFVETAETREWQGQTLQRLQDNVHLAEQLGARIATVYGEDPAEQIAQYAQVSGVTKIVMGRAGGRQSGNTLADRLIRLAGDTDIYIIPDHTSYRQENRMLQLCQREISLMDIVRMLLIMVVVLFGGDYLLQLGVSPVVPALLYLAGVILVAAWTSGRLCGALAAVGGILCYSFLFMPPISSVHAEEPVDVLTLLVMLICAVGGTVLMVHIKERAKKEIERANYSQALLAAVQKFNQSRSDGELLHAAAGQISHLMKRPVVYVQQEEEIHFHIFPPEMEEGHLPLYDTRKEHQAAERAMQQQSVRILEQPDPGVWCAYVPIYNGACTLGAVGIPVRGEEEPTLFEKNLIVAIAEECGQMMRKKNCVSRRQE